ncbi:MAG: toprim domain-containing protein [Planctomycetes bacterium]|nr:toprim domain-containing protein [Planctomycetota bacterium]
MARFSDEILERLKSEVSLLRLIESQGYQTKKQGKDFSLSCPFHEDDTPSLIITPSKNLFNCFGCGASGTVIDWVMKTQGVSFRFACEILQKDLGLIMESGTDICRDNTTIKLSPPLAANGDNQAALKQVIDYYHETLKQSPEVHEYLASRDLDCPKLIKRFRLGFANRTLGYHLPEKNRKVGAELRGQLQTIGILRPSGHEHFNGSLVVPVINEQGEILEVYGRKILGSKLRKGTAQHLYLPGKHRGVWNAQGLVEQSQLIEPNKVVILCEALIDAMTLWRHGFVNVTTSYGVNGFTDEHLALFQRLKITTILVAYDNDKAGNNAALKLAEKLLPLGFGLYRVEVPKSMDINSYANQVSPAQKSLSLILRQAKWMSVDGRNKDSASTLVAKLHTATTETASLREQKAELAKPAVKTNVSPIPDAPSLGIEAEITEQEIHITLAERCYRVRGLERNMGLEQLKINLLVKQNEAFHVDTLDLYSSKARFGFIKQAGIELGVNTQLIKADLGKVLLKLEDIQAEQLEETLAPENTEIVLSEEDKQAALELLKNPQLLECIVADFEVSGVVGERVNTLTGYLAGLSRKLNRPLAVMIQSSSAAGKSSLMDAVLHFMPSEERVQYSAMTGQSLFYMGTTNLKHKILAISEEEGANNASYALKLLQSEGEVTIASTGKNAATGNLETQEYRVEGPIMLFMTTTAIDIDEELMNRCLVLTVNESREQTQAIHTIQRQQRTLDGLLAGVEKERLVNLHQNAQRLLKPLAVVNPYADKLSFLDNQTRTRRDHEKYLTLIDSITLLHQYQREIKTVQGIEYIEATLDDIAVANALAGDVLGRTLDELPPQTRALLQHIYQMVEKLSQQQELTASSVRFSRRDIRNFTDWGNTQLKIHCQRLEDMEYLLIHRGGRGTPLVYELAWQGEGEQGDSFLLGLNGLENLGYDVNRSGVSKLLSALSRGQVGLKSEAGQPLENPLQLNGYPVLDDKAFKSSDNAYISGQKVGTSYLHTPTANAEGGHA